jgi:signal peptidase I
MEENFSWGPPHRQQDALPPRDRLRAAGAGAGSEAPGRRVFSPTSLSGFIKRVIALRASIRIENKKVFINGEPDDPTRIHRGPGTDEHVLRPRGDNMHEIVVPAGHYFVMGDNRDNSHDSRFWGTLPRDLLKGRALMIYWSFKSGRDAYLKEGWESFKELLSIFNPYKTRWNRFFHLVR